MNKAEFLLALAERLPGLPWEELEDQWSFYNEMIDDHMEQGLSEEEAVAQIGSVEEVSAQIRNDLPMTTLLEQDRSSRRLRGWEILLLILGSPIWLSLLISAAAVALSLYAVLWSVVVGLWTLPISFGAAALWTPLLTVLYAAKGEWLLAAALLGIALIFAGLAILFFFGCKAITKGSLWLTKKSFNGISSLFRKEKNS